AMVRCRRRSVRPDQPLPPFIPTPVTVTKPARVIAGFGVFSTDLILGRLAWPLSRRLTAILAADVAGDSRLRGADEEGTPGRLRAHLRELIEPKIAEHHGCVVKTTGDGFLAEFPSVVDAVRCSMEVQRGMAERNRTTPQEERIEFRIGINLGD